MYGLLFHPPPTPVFGARACVRVRYSSHWVCVISIPSPPLAAHCCNPTPPQAVVLRCLRDLCRDGQLLLDLFVNFDCDLESSNLFERLVNSLVRQAQLPVQVRKNGGKALAVYVSSSVTTGDAFMGGTSGTQ